MADPASSDQKSPDKTSVLAKSTGDGSSAVFRFFAWSLSGLVILSLVVALAIATVAGSRVSAPDWMRAHILQQINSRLDNGSVEAGDLSIRLDAGLVPRLGLRHVVLRDDTGEQVLQFGDVQSVVSLTALIRGSIRPAALHVSGAQMLVRRLEDGSVGLTLDASGSDLEVQEAGTAYRGLRLGVHDAMMQADEWLNQPEFENLTDVTLDNVTLRYEDARAGRVWTADGARLSLNRAGDALRLRADAALLTGGASATSFEMNYSRIIGENAAELGFTFNEIPAQDIAGQSPALAWLAALEAPISGALRAEVEESGALGPLHATFQIGQGALRPGGDAMPISFTSARTYFTYRPKEQRIDFSELSVDSAWLRAEGNGTAMLSGMESGWPEALGLEFELSRITANPLGLYPDPVALERAKLTMDLRVDPFVLDLAGLEIFDNGEVLTMRGRATAEPAGWHIGLAAELAQIAPERLLELWPTALAPKARAWIDTNVLQTRLSDIRFHLDALPKTEPSVFLGFDFEDFHARFIRDVSPLQAARGSGFLRDERFVIEAEAGRITSAQGGQIDVAGTRFIIPDVNLKRTPAEVALVAAAPITAALAFLDEPPFGFLARAGLPVDLAQGRAEVAGVISFEMADDLDVRDVIFDLSGALLEVETDRLMPGRILRSPRFDLATSQTGLQLSGAGQVGEVPFDGQYEMGFSAENAPDAALGRVTGNVEISQAFLDTFGINVPPGAFEGAGRADLQIDLRRDAPARLDLQTDLAGIALRFDALNWRLPAEATGRLQVTGAMGAQTEIDLIDVSAPGLEARGALTLTPEGVLETARFERVAAGTWLDAPVEIIGRGRGVPPQIRLRGGVVDLRRAQLNRTGGANAGGPLSLQLDRLILSDDFSLTGFGADISRAGRSGGPTGPFSGVLNGRAKITGQIVPKNGRSAFQIRSDNAGAFFAATGLIREARNGVVDLSLVPGDGAGIWEGKLTARGGMRVKEAPTMAALLNAATIVGLLEQLGGEGIHFEAVDARFQIAPERLTLYSMSATGAAIGLSMDGYYYLANKQMDLQGVISPFYVLNAVGGLISRPGEGLFGLSFTLRGPTTAPSVSVNPLSALTPGLIRDVFRRQPPQRDASGDEALEPNRAPEKRPGIGPGNGAGSDR